MGPIHQTWSLNNFAPTEPFPSILIVLDPLWKCLSNDITYENKENTIGIVRINGIFWDGYDKIWNTSEIQILLFLVSFPSF